MTAQCVNKNTSEFKTLAAVLGDAQAEGLSIQNNYVTPSVDDAFKMIKGNKLNQFKNAVSHVTKLSVADPEVLVSGFGKIIQKFNNRFFVVKGSKISEVPTEAARTHVEQRNLSFINFLNDKLGKIFNISSVSNIPAGKQLFSEPNPETKILSNQYKKEKGITTPSGSRFNIIDVDRAKRIANAFEAMKNEPNNTTVKAAYEQMAKETIDQFNTLVNAGYKVEIYEGIGEPYSNSQAMINDVRNKHQYILSTEKDFGTTSITDEDRKNNPLLRDSGLKDANGKTLLINDLFRSVHDFFGHTERGNAFGPIGEENAWDVHARMFTPLARRAMTSETRGQNSFVNFGPHMRNEKGDIIKKGEPGYLDPKQRPYADQKIGLLPEEFSNLDMPDINSITGTEPLVAGQALPTRFQQDQPTGHVEESLATARESNKGIGSRYLTDAIYYADGRVKGPASIPNQVVLPYSNKLLATKLKKLKESIRNMPAGEKKQKALDKMFTLADQAYSEFKTVLKNNLRGIYDAWDPELIKRSKHWYEGANRIAQTLANQYGLSVEVSSGIIAVLSPQNEWFNNINGAYRVMDVMKNFADKPVTAEMFDKVSDHVKGEPFELIMSGLRTKYEGKTFNDTTSDMDKANMLRVIDTAVHTEEVPTVSPEGAITGIKATGPFATRFAWGSTSEIFKAISIFSDPSLENVSKRLGKGNKVRNFYNNIVNPNSPNGEVTADTHALGAGLLNIVSAEESSSMGLFRNDINGNSPLYALLKESYQELAKEKGLLPRELQSIVWEATRLLIHESDKTLDNRTFTNDIWQQVQQNKLTQDEAIKQIIGHFKFIRPEWAGSTEQGGSTDVLQGTEYSLYEGGSIRSDIRRQSKDTGANTANVVEGNVIADGTHEVTVNQEALNKLVEKNKTFPADVPFEGSIPGEKYQKTSDTDAYWDNENAKRLAVSDIVGFLNSKYNIPFEYDTTMEVAAKFSGGKIFLNPNKIGLDSPFHEIAHPFVALMEQVHPDLYKGLVEELNSDYGKRELARVKDQYPELSEKEQKDEAIVSLIGKMSADIYGQQKVTDAQRSLFKRIVDFLKGVLHSLGFNSRDFTPGMSMREVAHLLVNPYYKYDFEANQRKVNLEQEYNQKASDADAISKFNNYIDNIIIRLRNDSKLKGKSDDENFRKYVSGKLADDIEKNRNDLETLNKFTDAALFNMLDLNRKADALREKYVAKKEKSKEDIAEMMHLLQQIDDHVAIYSDAANLIDVIKIIYPEDLEDENGEEKEPVDLRYSLETQHRLVEHYKDWATDAIADWLMPYYTKAINNAVNGGDITKAIPKELYNKTKLQLNNQKITDPKIIASVAAKQHIKNELLTAGNDTGFVTALFRGVLNTKDPIAQLVGLAITDVITKGLEKGRIASVKLGRLLKAKVGLKAFTTNKDWKELYKPFLRTTKVWTYKGLGKDGNKEYEYREHVAFHEEYKWDEFYDAKRKADEKRGPRPSKTDTAAFAKWYQDRNAWLAANTIFVKNPGGTELEDSVAAWDDYNKRKQAADEARGIRPAKKNKAELAKWKADREAWLTANPSPINNPSLKGGRLPSAAFKNAEWLTLQSDPFFKELYANYKESNDRLGLAGLRYGIVPQKELGGVSVPKKVPTAKGTAEALREFVGENEQIYYAQEIDGSERKSPKPYFTHMLDKDQELDYNLTDVVSKFSAASHRFHELSQVEEHVKILKNFIGGSHNLNIDKRQTYKKTTAGLSAFFKGQHVPVKGAAEHVNEQLLNFINDTCYGEGLKQDVVQLWDSKFQVTKKGETSPTVINGFEDLVQHTGLRNLDYKGFEFMKDRTIGDWTIRMVKKDWNFSVKKTANKLGLLTALSTMVFNPTAAVVNLVRAKIEQFVEGVGGKYFSLKDAAIGEAEYFKALGSGDFFDDLLRSKPSFLSSMLIDYDAIQGELQDIDGHKIDAGVANKLFRRNHLYFLQNGGEHQAQTSLMISMMNHQKVKLQDGTSISLFEARKREYGGQLKMADTNWTEDQDRGFRETLKFVNKTLNGNYDKLDKAGIQRRWWGSLLMMFKKHIPNMIINRYGKGYTHLESGQWTQGYYRTFIEGVANQLGSYILNKKMSQASWGAEQNYAARKLGADLFIVALLIMAFKAFDDDDKDDDLNDWGALAARRLISESGQYTPYLLPSELARIVSQPFASTSTVKAFSDAISQTISDPHDVYQRSGSGYKLGDNKAAVKWGRAIPIYKVTKYGQFERLLDYYRLNSRGLDWLKPSAGQQTEE